MMKNILNLKITYLKATILLILLLIANYFISELDSYVFIIICTCLINLSIAFICVNFFRHFSISTKINSKIAAISIVSAIGFIMINFSIGNIFQLMTYEKIFVNDGFTLKYSFITVVARVLLFPIVEEIFYRRTLAEGIYNQYGFKPALLVSSFGFSIMHIFADSGLLIIFLGGLFLGYIYLKTKNLLLVIGLHVLINSLVFFLSNELIVWLNLIEKKYLLSILIFLILVGIYFISFLKKLK